MRKRASLPLQNTSVAAKRSFRACWCVIVTRYSSCRLRRDLDLSFLRRIYENSSDLKLQPRPRRLPPATTAPSQFDTVQLIPVLCLAPASDEQPRGDWKSIPERVLLPGECGGGSGGLEAKQTNGFGSSASRGTGLLGKLQFPRGPSVSCPRAVCDTARLSLSFKAEEQSEPG